MLLNVFVQVRVLPPTDTILSKGGGIMDKWHYVEKSERLRLAEERVYKRMCSPRAQINRRLRDDIVGFLSDRRFQRNRERMH